MKEPRSVRLDGVRKKGNKRMIRIKTQNGNVISNKMIRELRDIARRKRRTAEHIERAIARHYQRQGLTDSIPRFDREEIKQG